MLKVVHFKKYFLNNTETFVYNQILNQQELEAYVLCRQNILNSNFDYSKIGSVFEIPFMVSWGVQKNIFALMGILGQKYKFDLKKIEEKLTEIKPDVIHAHFGPDANYILPAAVKLDIPLITSFYGYDVSEFPDSYSGLAKRAYRRLIEKGEMFIAMSDNMREKLEFLGFPGERIKVHHFGINYEYFDSRERSYQRNKDENFYLIQIASMIPKKGHIYTLLAMDKLINQLGKKKIILNLIGSGPLENELIQFVRERKLENNVKFLGFVPISDDYLDLLYQSHVYVHPSVTDKTGATEGIPTTLLEAMATGLPAVSSYHAGIPDVIDHEKNGLLIQEKETDKLVEYISKLEKDEQLRRQLGEKASEAIHENFNIRIQTHNLTDIYKAVLSRN